MVLALEANSALSYQNGLFFRVLAHCDVVRSFGKLLSAINFLEPAMLPIHRALHKIWIQESLPSDMFVLANDNLLWTVPSNVVVGVNVFLTGLLVAEADAVVVL